MKKSLIFATNNPGKLKEIRESAVEKYTVLSLKDVDMVTDIPEDHDTFRENALQKAEFIFDRTGVTTFADDSGLEVEALGGRPGVYSARYAGEECTPQDNIDKLLKELKGVDNRSARFKTVIAYKSKDAVSFFEGVCPGKILTSQTGTGGFGYDPVFVPDGFDQSFAEMPSALKNEISHRGKAVRKLIDFLK